MTHYLESKGEDLIPLCNRRVFVLGLIITLIGFGGMMGYGLGWPWLLKYVPGDVPMMRLPSALGIFCLGIALMTILDGTPYHKRSLWLWPVRFISLLVPAGIALYVVYLYLLRSQFDVLSILTQDFTEIIPGFMDNFILLLSAIVLLIFLKSKRSEPLIVYLINVPAMVILCLVLFAIVGYWQSIPVLFSFKLSLPTAIAYFLTSFAILTGTAPFQGLLMPLFSKTSMERIMAFSVLMMGIGVLIVGAYSISQFDHYIAGTNSPATDLQLYRLYINSEMLTIVLAILVTTLSLRTIHYFNKSSFYAREQALAKEEAEAAKANYRLLVEGVKDYAIFMLDAAGRIITWNTGAERIKGYHSDEILGRHCSVFYAETERLQGNPDEELRAAQREGRFESEGWCQRKDGSLFWASLITTALYHEDGNLAGFSKITRDITERKQAEEMLKKAHDDLEKRVEERTLELSKANASLKENERLRTMFISTLTHDLRTPLIAQKRVLEVLADEPKIQEDKELGSLVAGFLKNSDHLLKMVNILLETYQYEDGHIKLTLEPLNMQTLIAECMSEVHSLAVSQEIRVENQLQPDLTQVHGDFHQLKRVFLNLLGNAIENIPKGSLIQISAEDDGAFLAVQVRDNGPGIASDLLPHLFDRYFTGHPTRQKIGSGLGLFICKMIIDLHGGIIKAESVVGQGTSFVLHLPKQSSQEGT